jgi:aminomethyltransferase
MIGTSKDIKSPGLRTLPLGVERYVVKGGGISVIEVFPEDKIDLINNEGKQISEIVVFDSNGKSNLSILELKEN